MPGSATWGKTPPIKNKIMTLSFNKQNVQERRFVEKIHQGLYQNNIVDGVEVLFPYVRQIIEKGYLDMMKRVENPKILAIQKGQRCQSGDEIRFMITNYLSIPLQFAPTIECTGVQHIQMLHYKGEKYPLIIIHNQVLDYDLADDRPILDNLAINDGFSSFKEFLQYFSEDFEGQIIHWTNLRY